MSTALQPAREDKLSIWIHQPENYEPISAAVGEVMKPETFIAHMMVALNDPKVACKSNASKAKAIMKCAAVGMLPTLGQVALVPYGDDIEATIQWQGYKAQFERIQGVLEATAYLVHIIDEFAFENGTPIHRMDPFDPKREIKKLSDIRGGYLKIIFTDGRPPKYHFVTLRHIEKCRACAKTKNIWDSWPEQMAMKTVYRDAYARRILPIDPLVLERMERVIKADDIDLGNDPTRIERDFPSLADRLNRTAITQQPEEPPQDAPQNEQPLADTQPSPNDIDITQWNDVIFQSESAERLDEIEANWRELPDGDAKGVIAKSIAEKRKAFNRKPRGERSNKSLLDQ